MPIRIEPVYKRNRQVDLLAIEDPRPYSDSERISMLFRAAQDILNDGCPVDPKMHLCSMGEEQDCDECNRCWETYLFYLLNGGRQDPYRCDRSRDE